LLQQLVSQNADIVERMIIPVDELAKATNNIEKTRELGGGRAQYCLQRHFIISICCSHQEVKDYSSRRNR
jgi:hypothetical protein